MSPQKARLVVDLIRGKDVNEALMTLKFTNKKATDEIEKVVKSAVANATQKSENIDVDKLFIETAFINEGPRLKRIRPAPMGRAYRYQRRTAHLEIVLAEKLSGNGKAGLATTVGDASATPAKKSAKKAPAKKSVAKKKAPAKKFAGKKTAGKK